MLTSIKFEFDEFTGFATATGELSDGERLRSTVYLYPFIVSAKPEVVQQIVARAHSRMAHEMIHYEADKQGGK